MVQIEPFDFSWLGGRDDQHEHGQRRERAARIEPEGLPADQAMHQRADRELPGKAAEHAGKLRDANGGRQPFRREPVHGEINGAGEGEGRASALQQPSTFHSW